MRRVAKFYYPVVGIVLLASFAIGGISYVVFAASDGPEPWWVNGFFYVAAASLAIFLLSMLLEWLLHAEMMGMSAAGLGLRHASGDVAALADIAPESRPSPGEQLEKDDETFDFENVYSGTWNGLDVRLFEFRTVYHPRWAESSTTWRYSCAAVRRPTGRRRASIESRTLRRHYTKNPGSQPYTTWNWQGGLEASLQEWLASLEGDWGFKVADPWIFYYMTPQVTSREAIVELLTTLEGFVARLGEPLPPPPPPHIWGSGDPSPATP